MSKPKAPAAPDYVGAAQAQGSANVDAALAGTSLATPNQVNPFGTTSWANTGYDAAMQQWLAQQPGGAGGATGAGTGVVSPGYGPTSGVRDNIELSSAANPFIPGTAIGGAAGTTLQNLGVPSPSSVLGKGDGSKPPSYTPSPEETAYNNWLSSKPSQDKYTKPGDWTLTSQFSPELQKLYDRTSSNPLAPADLGAGAEANRQTASDALYKRATMYLDPQVEQQRTALQARLNDQGIMPGSEAYTYQMGQFEKNYGQQYDAARQSAIAGGGAEADRTYAENLKTAQQRELERELPFQEYQTLKGLLPSANPSAQSVQATPILQALQQQYGASLNQYGIEAGQAGATNTAAATSIAAIIAALVCDPALKTDVRPAEPVLDKLEKVHIHHFRYKPGVPDVGVGGMVFTGPMADEWAEQFGGDGKKIELLSVLGVIMKGMQELRAEIRSLKAGG